MQRLNFLMFIGPFFDIEIHNRCDEITEIKIVWLKNLVKWSKIIN